MKKLTALFVGIFTVFVATESVAAVKKETVKKHVVRQAVVKKAKTAKKSTSKKAVNRANHSLRYYGVKGHKLQPTKVSRKTYRYKIKGKAYQTVGVEASRQYSQTGEASYYGGMFNGRKTANGEIFNENLYTAAHKTLALGSYALVTNLRNNKKIVVKINDRGPFSKGRIIDLSKGAAREIDMVYAGVAPVKVDAFQVDKQGYLHGKGAKSLYNIAQKAGLPLIVKPNSTTFAFKADERGKKK